MAMRALVLLIFVGVSGAWWPPVASAQPPDASNALQFVQIGDMLLEVSTQHPAASGASRAAVADFRTADGYWDFGVIPYALSSEFTDAQRQRILTAMQHWTAQAPIVFVERTTQTGYVDITKWAASDGVAGLCYSTVGQPRRGVRLQTNLGGTCADDQGIVYHELGHAIGLYDEQNRQDRDAYVEIDVANVRPDALGYFTKLNVPVHGSYDFGSIMHDAANVFAIDPSKPTILPRPGYASFAPVMGQRRAPTSSDHAVVAFLYEGQLRASGVAGPAEAPRRSFDRDDFLVAMERLHALYMSEYGLHRSAGLSVDGRPDFSGIAQWIFEIYLGARSAGWSATGAFDIVTAGVTQSIGWQQNNPGLCPLIPAWFEPAITLDRAEFVDAMQQLDAFYRSADGLRRSNGLSVNGGPDFSAIATWIFDVYLTERLRGISAAAAWTLTRNAIQETEEWRRKH
jgi:hypothetical protein